MGMRLAVLLATAIFLSAPSAEAARLKEALVGVPVASLYKTRGPRAKLVSQAFLGDRVKILRTRKGWVRVRLPSQRGFTGWIRKKRLVQQTPANRAFFDPSTPFVVVKIPQTLLRASGKKPIEVYGGTVLPAKAGGMSDRGVEVLLPDGTTAVLSAPAVRSFQQGGTPNSAEGAVASARRYSGIRYLWGGMSPLGVDSAGLVYVAYRMQGVLLERSVLTQSRMGQEVNVSDARPGDLLFFAINGPKISHVGIYARAGRFVHATRNGVKESPLKDPYFQRHFVKAGRVVEDPREARNRVAALQKEVAGLAVGKRVAFWAEHFLGRPYDTDPLGAYVRREAIVADDRLDCMYHTFRSTELALSRTPEEAVQKALDLRFHNRGRLAENGRVLNYAERFQYGEDMIDSGKWGREITAELGQTREISGSRGRKSVRIVPATALRTQAVLKKLQSGDILFFIKVPRKRVVGEIVGHIGLVSRVKGVPYLIHASGVKASAKRKGKGVVGKIPVRDYARTMPFVGVRVTRMDDSSVGDRHAR